MSLKKILFGMEEDTEEVTNEIPNEEIKETEEEAIETTPETTPEESIVKETPSNPEEAVAEELQNVDSKDINENLDTGYTSEEGEETPPIEEVNEALSKGLEELEELAEPEVNIEIKPDDLFVNSDDDKEEGGDAMTAGGIMPDEITEDSELVKTIKEATDAATVEIIGGFDTKNNEELHSTEPAEQTVDFTADKEETETVDSTIISTISGNPSTAPAQEDEDTASDKISAIIKEFQDSDDSSALVENGTISNTTGETPTDATVSENAAVGSFKINELNIMSGDGSGNVAVDIDVLTIDDSSAQATVANPEEVGIIPVDTVDQVELPPELKEEFDAMTGRSEAADKEAEADTKKLEEEVNEEEETDLSETTSEEAPNESAEETKTTEEEVKEYDDEEETNMTTGTEEEECENLTNSISENIAAMDQIVDFEDVDGNPADVDGFIKADDVTEVIDSLIDENLDADVTVEAPSENTEVSEVGTEDEEETDLAETVTEENEVKEEEAVAETAEVADESPSEFNVPQDEDFLNPENIAGHPSTEEDDLNRIFDEFENGSAVTVTADSVEFDGANPPSENSSSVEE